MRHLIFLPFAGLVVLAGYLGWQMGQPLTETDVINFHAAQWVEDGPAGAALTDCLAVPANDAQVWLHVVCTHQNGNSRRITVAPGGRAVAVSSEQEPQA